MLRNYPAPYSAPRGYDVSLREEADALKKGTRERRAKEHAKERAKEPVKLSPTTEKQDTRNTVSWKSIVGIPLYIGRALLKVALFVIGGAVAITIH